MVKIFLVVLFLSGPSFAQTDFQFISKIPSVTEKFNAMKLEDDISFETGFNQIVKELETVLDREKNICIGEMSDEEGKVISKENRQVCLRVLKGHYLKSLSEMHTLKKRYMVLIHQKQLKQFDENFLNLKEKFEKSF